MSVTMATVDDLARCSGAGIPVASGGSGGQGPGVLGPIVDVAVARASTLSWDPATVAASDVLRARVFTDPALVGRFLAGRWLLRRMIEHRGRPAHLPFEEGMPPAAGATLTRSGDLILAAVSAGEPIGIDAEIEERWPLASEALRMSDPEAAATAWVRLEAVVKAAGVGFVGGIDRDLAQAVLRSDRIRWHGVDWKLWDLRVPGAKASLAAAPDAQWRWDGRWRI